MGYSRSNEIPEAVRRRVWDHAICGDMRGGEESEGSCVSGERV